MLFRSRAAPKTCMHKLMSISPTMTVATVGMILMNGMAIWKSNYGFTGRRAVSALVISMNKALCV